MALSEKYEKKFPHLVSGPPPAPQLPPLPGLPKLPGTVSPPELPLMAARAAAALEPGLLRV